MPQEKKEVETVFRKVSVKERLPKDTLPRIYKMLDGTFGEKFSYHKEQIKILKRTAEYWLEEVPTPNEAVSLPSEYKKLLIKLNHTIDEMWNAPASERLIADKWQKNICKVQSECSRMIIATLSSNSVLDKEELLRWIEEEKQPYIDGDGFETGKHTVYAEDLKTKILSLSTQQK